MGNKGGNARREIRIEMQGIRVRMQGITVGNWGIKVGMWGIRVGMRVYKYLTGILRGLFLDKISLVIFLKLRKR